MSTDRNLNRIIAKRYRLVELIGTGAMGYVYRAEDKLLGDTTVAVKFLAQTLLNQKMRDRFEREATICANLAERSIHVVGVRDYGVDENRVPYYVMEFLQGVSLGDIIQDQNISLPRFLSLTRQICLGLESAHKGIVFKGEHSPIIHRDIKPSNIYVLEDPTIGELVKVLDFGIAKLISSDNNQTNSFMGTLAYCSPEQMEGKELDNRSDIYSLGVMMYEMLTNQMPIIPETPTFPGWYKAHHELPPREFKASLNIPYELEKLIFKCLAKKPNSRPQSITEILSVLEKIKTELQSPSPQQKLSPQNDKNFTSSTTEIIIPRREESYLEASWPKDKPQQKIVFPRVMEINQKSYPTLWVMLEYEDIRHRLSSIRYNQFLYLASPHPMILWITVLYHQEHGPRWLPCYLDLKTDLGLQVALLLSKTSSYSILFFAINEDPKCKHVMKATIAQRQCQLLRNWTQDSRNIKYFGKPQASKRHLKQEFEHLKPKIIEKLLKVQTLN